MSKVYDVQEKSSIIIMVVERCEYAGEKEPLKRGAWVTVGDGAYWKGIGAERELPNLLAARAYAEGYKTAVEDIIGLPVYIQDMAALLQSECSFCGWTDGEHAPSCPYEGTEGGL